MIYIFILIHKKSNPFYYHKSIDNIKYYLNNIPFTIINTPIDNNDHQYNHHLINKSIINNKINDNDFIVRFYYHDYLITFPSNFFKYLANLNSNIHSISRPYFFQLIGIRYSFFKLLDFHENDNNSSYELKWEKIKNSIPDNQSINLNYLGINIAPISNSIFTIY